MAPQKTSCPSPREAIVGGFSSPPRPRDSMASTTALVVPTAWPFLSSVCFRKAPSRPSPFAKVRRRGRRDRRRRTSSPKASGSISINKSPWTATNSSSGRNVAKASQYSKVSSTMTRRLVDLSPRARRILKPKGPCFRKSTSYKRPARSKSSRRSAYASPMYWSRVKFSMATFFDRGVSPVRSLRPGCDNARTFAGSSDGGIASWLFDRRFRCAGVCHW
mmetsp:Transcript_30900/g.99690  ORF Transcript_30900/g.99690 Transcript_30900/m.99690 type:complete len:219 (-) Transcript_30900:183-839(-)